MKQGAVHTFHIPVMGLGFTIDTALKVAKFGISSVLSVMEDHLIESIRESISLKRGLPYEKIELNAEDHRAGRITAYLNLLKKLVDQDFAKLKNSAFESCDDINQYFEMLPNDSELRKLYNTQLTLENEEKVAVQDILRSAMVPGSIDVNIMTKLNRTNYDVDGNALGPEFADGLAALRGYALSDLDSSIIFSAGLNPQLYAYCETFSDFYPDANGHIKKRIVLKVSDYRSALIQGKYLAKKGLWVSEFRIESGINCGGHAFISAGILMGPILEEFKEKRGELYRELYKDCQKALAEKNKAGLKETQDLHITAQGGIGNYSEDDFLLKYYKLDASGWGSPFLLVPEVTNVDAETLGKLSVAKPSEYYLSNSSPLGVPFNNFRSSSSEVQRLHRIEKGRPGSPCYKKFLSSNTEFTDRPICTASRQYQKLKIDALKASEHNPEILQREIEKLEEKDCLCEGLGASALIVNNAKISHNLNAVSICPGPNLAYFTGIFSLREMCDHIYGRKNLLNNVPRSNMYLNELKLYIDHIRKEFRESIGVMNNKRRTYFDTFRKNLQDGIQYYQDMCRNSDPAFTVFPLSNLKILDDLKEQIRMIYESKDAGIQIPVHKD